MSGARFLSRLVLWLGLAAAALGQRPNWDRVQHFVFVLLPEGSFDQYFGGFADSEGVPGALGPREIPNLWAYAELYTLQDHFFASANAAALLRTQTARLDAAGVSWKEYAGDLEEYLADCRTERLPAVSFLTAGVDVASLTRIVNGVAASRLWRRSAVFVSFAEAGEAPDHVKPPPGYGRRVPSLVISAWARLGYNDHRVYTHRSWLRSIENRFGLPHAEDAVADLYDPFDFAQQPRDPVMLAVDGKGSYPAPGQGQVFPAAGWLDSVHRSHGTWTVAAGSMVIGYGDGFADEGEEQAAVVWVTDAAGVQRQAEVQYTGKTQVNYVVPDGTATGLARVRIDTARLRYDGFLLVERVSPGLFTATQMGQGPADGVAEGESTFVCQEWVCRCAAVRGRLVSLRGTGIRNAGTVRAWVEGEEARVVRAGADGGVSGLDWVELEVPETAAGKAMVMVEADGRLANSVQLMLAPRL